MGLGVLAKLGLSCDVEVLNRIQIVEQPGTTCKVP